jgi:hypothetical protein
LLAIYEAISLLPHMEEEAGGLGREDLVLLQIR